MQTFGVHRSRPPRAPALLALVCVFAPGIAVAAEKNTDVWPAAVHARYRLKYNGITVGDLEVNSKTADKTYSLSGSGKVSVLFGTVTWSGSSNVSGTIEGGRPQPAAYGFQWRNNKKSGGIQIRYKNTVASDIAITPPPEPHADTVPLSPLHKSGALDPVTAVLMLTKPDQRPPCDRRVPIFDGKQRYDIVLSHKRMTRIASRDGSPASIGYVCRAVYEPVAGHRDNESTKTYASNRDVEVVMRHVPGTQMFIPHSVTIPTMWGTGTMITERIDVSSPGIGTIALTE